jgi:hypothetical protein
VKADWEHGVSSLGQDQNYGAKFKKDWSALADDFRTFLLGADTFELAISAV